MAAMLVTPASQLQQLVLKWIKLWCQNLNNYFPDTCSDWTMNFGKQYF